MNYSKTLSVVFAFLLGLYLSAAPSALMAETQGGASTPAHAHHSHPKPKKTASVKKREHKKGVTKKTPTPPPAAENTAKQ